MTDIMEVTLRDGSYVIDFQFTAQDTATLVSALEGAGFKWIEIGHGLGLNASDKGQRRAAASDEAHMEAAAHAAQQAKWGAFFIPGIGRAEDVDLAARYNMDFIRIGTNVTESDRARPFMEQAKAHGMFVCYNAMKSYAATPQEFAQVAKQTQAWGADMVYIVDSAGTMLPEDVEAFIKAIQDETDVAIGFHGHDNLSMGMANTLQAIESGAAVVDSSLRGMGRSAGNVITEALLAIMQRRGYARDIDLKATMDISSGFIAPLVPGRGLDTMAITAGYAGFHSSFTAKVKDYAERFSIDVRDLIVALCEQNRVNAPDDLLEKLSTDIARQQQPRILNIPAFEMRNSELETATLEDALTRMYSEAQKYRTSTALNVVVSQTLEDDYRVGNHIHTTPTHTISSVSISNEMQLVDVLNTVDGQVDVVFLDTDRRRIFGPQMAAFTAKDLLKQSQLIAYSDTRVWAEAVKDQVVRLLDEQVQGAKIVIAGNNPRSRLLALMLLDYGADITVAVRQEMTRNAAATGYFSLSLYPQIRYVQGAEAGQYIEEAQVVVVWTETTGAWFGASMAGHLSEGTYLLDAGLGSIEPSGLAIARERGALPVRVDIWATLAGALLAAHQGTQVKPAWGAIEGVPLVANGAIGEKGALIVDDVENPTYIIGVADGTGHLVQQTSDYREQLRIVTEAMNQRRIQPQV